MKKSFLLVLSCLFLLSIGQAQEVTFSKHIAPIIYNNCTTCHRAGEIGPMALTNYEEVSAWGPMIAYVTGIRYMPPWRADPTFSSFLGERYLTEEEIDLISEWVDAGMPQGNVADEPNLPEFPTGSQVGEPDLVLSFAESFTHQGGNEDEYRVFVLPTNLTEDRVLDAIELRPGNTKIVHHALFTYDTQGRGRDLDAQDETYGYDGFGGFGINDVFDKQFPGYVPGQKARRYPGQIGQLLPAGADILVQMHYAPTPFEESDSSTVNIFFKDGPVERYVENYVMLPFGGTLENGPFVIRPNEVKTFKGVFEVPYDVSVVSIAPHMHLLGQDWEVIAISPQGDTTNLIRVSEWDFNWQGSYNFKRFIPVSEGSEIHAYATYDNTAENPLNPNNPPKFVSWGEKTTDEMYYLPISFVPYQEGDEDIIFEEDQTTSTNNEVTLNFPKNKLYPVFPNPVQDQMTIGFSLAHTTKVSVEILDLSGRVVRRIINDEFHLVGNHQLEADLSDLASGVYLVNLKNKYFSLTEKFAIAR